MNCFNKDYSERSEKNLVFWSQVELCGISFKFFTNDSVVKSYKAESSQAKRKILH